MLKQRAHHLVEQADRLMYENAKTLIDGQARLEALKELGRKVEFIPKMHARPADQTNPVNVALGGSSKSVMAKLLTTLLSKVSISSKKERQRKRKEQLILLSKISSPLAQPEDQPELFQAFTEDQLYYNTYFNDFGIGQFDEW